MIPTLQGTRLGSNVPLLTLPQVIERIQQTLFPPNRHTPETLLVFGLNAQVLSLLHLDTKPQLAVRDVNRFPLSPSLLHPARVTHDFFVTPTTPITLRDPLAGLMEYGSLLLFTLGT